MSDTPKSTPDPAPKEGRLTKESLAAILESKDLPRPDDGDPTVPGILKPSMWRHIKSGDHYVLYDLALSEEDPFSTRVSYYPVGNDRVRWTRRIESWMEKFEPIIGEDV